jgi:hypothetical protein
MPFVIYVTTCGFVGMQKFVKWHFKCMDSSNVKLNMAILLFSVSLLSFVSHMKLMLFYFSRRQARL